MGDRAMAEIKTEGGSIYFYTHWAGYELVDMAQAAMDAALPRKGDSPYATKIVIDNLIRQGGGRDEETGGGIMLAPSAEDSYNNDQPSVILDLNEWTLTSKGHDR